MVVVLLILTPLSTILALCCASQSIAQRSSLRCMINRGPLVELFAARLTTLSARPSQLVYGAVIVTFVLLFFFLPFLLRVALATHDDATIHFLRHLRFFAVPFRIALSLQRKVFLVCPPLSISMHCTLWAFLYRMVFSGVFFVLCLFLFLSTSVP